MYGFVSNPGTNQVMRLAVLLAVFWIAVYLNKTSRRR
jgi:hypothetical protein